MAAVDEIARAIVEEAVGTDAAETRPWGISAATRCPRSSRRAKGGRVGGAMRVSGWISAARSRRSRFHARGRSGCERKRRLEEELAADRDANAQYEAYRARGRMKDG